MNQQHLIAKRVIKRGKRAWGLMTLIRRRGLVGCVHNRQRRAGEEGVAIFFHNFILYSRSPSKMDDG